MRNINVPRVEPSGVKQEANSTPFSIYWLALGNEIFEGNFPVVKWATSRGLADEHELLQVLEISIVYNMHMRRVVIGVLGLVRKLQVMAT